ncbi:MAG: polysaccharide biosynthesis/export family protein [Deferrisomatales bacterium]
MGPTTGGADRSRGRGGSWRRWAAVGAAWLLLVAGGGRALAVQEYLVGEGDVLKVSVYEHPDLTTVARVAADGTIRFSLVGAVEVGGLTVAQIGERLAAQLADGYLVDPQVAVFVEEFRSQKAIIMGQVVKPGLFELRGQSTFLELLSKAGGLTKDAADKAVIKRKPTPGHPDGVVSVDLKRLMEGGELTLDVPILDGDSVYIGSAGLYYVTGQVKKADAYKHEPGTTLIMAVTVAGGFTDKAATGRAKIIRKVGDKEVVLEKVNLQELVLPGDVIVVPESFF